MADDNNPPFFKIEPDGGTKGMYHVLMYDHQTHNYGNAGHYTVIDSQEDKAITDKKMINLAALLNGTSPEIDFTSLTHERVLFSLNQNNPDDAYQTIVFRTLKNEGVSKDNAVLTLKKEALERLQKR